MSVRICSARLTTNCAIGSVRWRCARICAGSLASRDAGSEPPWTRPATTFVSGSRNLSPTLAFPFFKDLIVDLGTLYVPFVVFVLVGASNAVNLTDGLDGLAIGAAGNRIVAGYLQIPSVPGVGEVTVFCGALVGAALGFLWFNAHPAEVFMGDVGSLALGGGITIVALMTKQELLLAVVGGLFVLEALSVIVQVTSYRLRGKRVFRMAPLHHHFELLGWPEPKVIIRFWILAILFALMSLSTLKLR